MNCDICNYKLRESLTKGTYCPNLACDQYVKNCNCCTLEVEVSDGSPYCHYCYLRECTLNLGKCANALTIVKAVK